MLVLIQALRLSGKSSAKKWIVFRRWLATFRPRLAKIFLQLILCSTRWSQLFDKVSQPAEEFGETEEN